MHSACQRTNLNSVVVARPERLRCPVLSAALLLSACGSSNAAAPAGQQSGQRTKSVFAVSGISPGMAAADVSSAALRAGYQLQRQDKGTDWQRELKKAKTGNPFQLSEPLRGISSQEYRKGAESISVDYLAMPSGPVAYLVTYTAAPTVLTYSEAAKELTRRYGKSSFSSQAASPWAQWCTEPAQTTRDCLRSNHLTLSESSRGITISTQNEGLREQQKRSLRQSGGKATF